MDENNEAINTDEEQVKVPESPKPLAFTIDFGEGKVDSQRHNKLVEKLRHRRGQSLSKLEGASTPSPKNKNSNSGNNTAARKLNNFQLEGYLSSDEKTEHLKNVRATANNIRLKDSLSNNKMTQSCVLPCVSSPRSETKEFGFDLNTSFTINDPSPILNDNLFGFSDITPENKNDFIGTIECEYDKSDSVSEAGTYTLDADNYSEEQKARMCIDKEFKIEEVSVLKKTEAYVNSLLSNSESVVRKDYANDREVKYLNVNEPTIVKPQTLDLNSGLQRVVRILDQKQKALSPILSPTQQFSITHTNPSKQDNDVKKLFNQIMFPSAKEKTPTSPDTAPVDQGSVISVTSSGAFRSRSDKKKHVKNFSLSKSGVQIEAYTENKYQNEIVVHAALTLNKNTGANLTANVIHVSDNISRVKNSDPVASESKVVRSHEMLVRGNSNLSKESNLSPGSLCGKTSPTKIPSPIHTSRPRSSSNSASFANTDLSDSSLETDSYLKPTQNIIKSSITSDHQKIDRNVYGDTESSSEEDFEKNFKKKDITNTRYNRAFSLRRARLEPDTTSHPKCPNTPEMRRKFQTSEIRPERAISVDRKPVKANEVQSRYLQNISKKSAPPAGKNDLPPKSVPISSTSGKSPFTKLQGFSRIDSGRFSMRSSTNPSKNLRKDHQEKKKSGGRSNSSLSSREVEFQNWKRRKSYDPMKAAAEGKRKAEMARRQNSLTQSPTDTNQDCDSSPSHSSSVHRSQSFHGTAALEQLISSDEEDLTLSVDEGFSPPTPSPCELSPARASLRYAWKD
ncbi:hypothetical protein MML48_1g08586 [Holotrichia oblita]|uniref:Uncharacterized protein n=1 Tax=Holotrichia oblita TaxID=644536 RepID=A0ACB9TXH2_HOLOL|nr:hypothetical protein MML48_1g08586 [Holotrichia oblita]